MVGRGDRVCVGVSGGKDSLALLHVLSGMAPRRGIELVPVTVDEGIPGYRDEALAIVERFCSSLGLAHHVVSYESLFGTTLEGALGEPSRQSSCAICGTLRRRALDVAAARLGADSVATAHNLDDMLQTTLINIMSGDVERIAREDPGGAGRAGARRIKPFCDIYEAEVAFYAYSESIPFQAESCPHMGEGIRTEVREFLNGLESRHSGIKNSMRRSAAEIAGRLRETARAGPPSPCERCGAPCAGRACSACLTLESLRGGAGAAPHARAAPLGKYTTARAGRAVAGRAGVLAVPRSETGYTQRPATGG